MDLKEYLGLAAAIISGASGIWYFVTIVQGKTKPHLYTYIQWSLLTIILFAGQWVSDAGPGAWAALVAAITTIMVLPLCFKYGTRDITFGDTLALVLGLASIIPWILTENPFWSLILVNAIDAWAMLPTYRKTWNDPYSESLSPWLLTELKHVLVFSALRSYSLNTYLYPLQAFLVNGILIAIIVYRRRTVRR
jgi:hypothetical protein